MRGVYEVKTFRERFEQHNSGRFRAHTTPEQRMRLFTDAVVLNKIFNSAVLLTLTEGFASEDPEYDNILRRGKELKESCHLWADEIESYIVWFGTIYCGMSAQRCQEISTRYRNFIDGSL